MASPATDDLLQRARTGESAAFEQLWHEHRRWLAVVLLAHMPHESEVEDLLQEVAVKMVEKIHELEDPAKLRPWLRKVALNTACSAGRKASLRRRILRRLDPFHHRIADEHAQKDERALAARMAAERALQAARQLPEIYREALLLKAIEGMSQRAIAQTLSVPETTVETRLARARRLLRERLDEEKAPVKAVARQGE